ncbi:unnamed protein product [Rhizoctonia solani]|uniref:Nephrocystin 3-like N-terminal domain-containing protein n=1 Tax=Rhizoctonia solani TaxID=456999 RepID=A0A8H3HUS9_9AGAM|nr:unnamed protein product [Rhizoctonia solani]
MSTGSSAHAAELSRHWITGIEISPDNTDSNCKFSAKLFVDNEFACSLPWIEHPRPLRWSGLLLCNVSPSSKLSLRLCRSVRDRPRYFNFPGTNISDADQETGELIQELPEAVWVSITTCLTPELAAELFPDKLDAFNRTENTHDDLASDETETWTLKDHFKCAMRFARATAEACPESQAKVSFLIYMKAWEMLDKQTHLDDTVRDMLRGLIRIRDVVDIIGQASNSMIATAMNQSKELIQDILALLEDISLYILNRCGANDLAEIPRKEESDEASYAEAQLARLEDLQKQFYALWSASSISSACTVNLREDSNTSPQEMQSVVDESTSMADLDRILSYLRPINPSGYNPDLACMNDTCEAILNRVLTWTQNRENGESIMWISGQPGTGKTAIAASLCQRLDSVQALAGSFFCQRGDSNLSTPLKVINSLICDIAMCCPAYAHEVAKAIRMTPKLHNAHLSLRFEGLVKTPLGRLKSLARPMTLVVVIDALNECGDRESRKHLMLKLYEMSRLVPWLKIIFTGRPTGDIQEYFQDHCPRGTMIQVHDYDASSDIRAYLQAQLGSLARIGHWPHDTIGNLCDMAEGVFLWAVMATQYITKYPLPALSRLRRLLDGHRALVSDHFDQLYTQTLEVILEDGNEETKDAYLRCISVILVTSKQESISTSDLHDFLLAATGVNQTIFNQILTEFGPLLCVKDGRPTSFYHSSFVDYITNASRSGKFHIQLDQYNAECAQFCFRVMQRDLKFNICGLQTSHIPNSEVPDLKLRVQSHIGPALRYACTHWLSHFTTSPNPGLVVSVKELFNGPQLMYWIEVLSLLGRLDAVMEQLPKLISLELLIHGDYAHPTGIVRYERRLIYHRKRRANADTYPIRLIWLLDVSIHFMTRFSLTLRLRHANENIRPRTGYASVSSPPPKGLADLYVGLYEGGNWKETCRVLLMGNVSPSSNLSIRLCRSVRDRPRYFNFPAVNLSDVDPETGELTHQLPESVWVPTTTCLTIELAAQLFPDKLDAFNRTENTQDDLASDDTETRTLKDHFKCAMRFAGAIAEACPESQAKVSFLIYMQAWEILDKQTHLDDTAEDILRGLIRIRDIAEIVDQASNSMIATVMNHSKELIQNILTLLEDISVYILNKYDANDLANIPDEGEPEDTSYAEAHLARLEDLQRQFHALWSTSSISSPDTVNSADGGPSNTSPQEIQSVIDESTRMADLDRILSYLKPVDPSGYNPDQACMNGTREAILNRVLTWTQNREKGESIMWISGQPGTGKTAIATSLCQRLDSVKALAGSFFCQRGDSNLSTPLKVINNLVCDIAMSCPPYAHEVAKAIRMTPKLHIAHLSLRFEGLVKRPLEKLRSLAIPMTLVVVIDALDECGDRESRKQLLQQLCEMSRLVPWLKLILTGRPIGDMQTYFQDHCHRGTKIQMYDYDASSDIRAYLETQLGPLARIGHWPHDTIGNLCDMAEGVFLWALRTRCTVPFSLGNLPPRVSLDPARNRSASDGTPTQRFRTSKSYGKSPNDASETQTSLPSPHLA